MRKLRTLILCGLIFIFPVVSVAAPPKSDLVAQVNEVFDQLAQAYMQEDLKLFLRVHHQPLIGADMINKATFVFTKEQLIQEMAYAFDNFDGIRLRFDEREIQVIGDTAYATTVRMFTAEGLPEFHVRLAFALKRVFPLWGRWWNWEITDQIMVEEWVVEKPGLCRQGISTQPQVRRGLFW